jgi:hypothetical protein
VTSIAQYSDAFAAFQAAAATLSGGDQRPLLRFQKGDWYLGQDNEEIPNGTRLAANIIEAEWGWVRWQDSKPVERKMVRVATGVSPAGRDTLGHNDKELWDRDSEGRPRDPWQFMIDIPAREIGGAKREITFSGGSKGWEGCCKALFSDFGEGMRINPGKTPIVELGTDKYTHKVYGVTKVPALKLVEWKSEGDLDAAAPAKGKAAKF